MGPIQAIRVLLHDMEQTIYPQPGILKKIYFLMDSGLSYWLLGSTQRDYLDFEFYRRSFKERNTFLTGKRYARMVKIYNREEDGKLFRDKAKFMEIFAPYVGRTWLDAQSTSRGDVLDFFQGKDEVFVKPKEGEKGYGLSLESVRTAKDQEQLLKKLIGQPYIIEEKIRQHSDLAAFNPNTVNSLRVYTLLEQNDVRILSVSLKMGRYEDSIADNVSAGGIFAVVDEATGLLVSPGLDKDHHRYDNHPLTHKRIIGTQIPHWQDVISFITVLANRVPSVRYVGWDIGIDYAGRPLVIEGNHNGGRRALQFADQVGKYFFFKEMF